MSDRLGRSLGHLLQLLGEFDANGVRLLVHDMAIDTSTPQGKLFFSMVVGDAPRKGLIIMGSAIAWDVMMVAFGFSRSFPLSIGLLFVMGIAAAAHENAIATVLQLSSAEHIRGRIMSLYHIADASFPLGFIAGGALAAQVGNELALVLGAAVSTPVLLLIYARSPALRRR